MIKITDIVPVDGRSTSLSQLAPQFLQRAKSYPYTALVQVIRSRRFSGEQAKVLTYIRKNFDKLIVGTPAELAQHITQINNELFGRMRATNFGQRFVTTAFGKAVVDIFGYDKHFRTTKTKGLWLAAQLNIKSCPYCNSQYTLFIQRSDRTGRAKFQFDHFYSKNRFPYLGVSLYNLIPSCSPCNLIKGDTATALDTHYHPYHMDLAAISAFSAEVPIEIDKLSTGKVKTLHIPIDFKAKFSNHAAFVDRHDVLFDIKSHYTRHVDIVQDLLYKTIANNSSFKKDLMAIKGLFDDDEALYHRYLIGNYPSPDQILYRPLAKFTQDIARQFGLIP
jgi:hypothetical protein